MSTRTKHHAQTELPALIAGVSVAELLRECYQYAWEYSHDRKTKNGALFIPDWSNPGLTYGTNHLPEGYEPTSENLESRVKDKIIIHAEEDVIFKSASEGTPTKGGTIICSWAPCTRCARAIISAEVSRLIVHKEAHDRTYEKYVADIEYAICMLCTAGVEYHQWSGKVGECQGLMDFTVWEP